jgi:hypothetical protein
MGTYRLLFFDDGIVCGRFDLQARDDDRAAETAEILFQACSDCCQSWGIWEGTEFVSSGPMKLRTRLGASDLTEQRQENIVRCEEAMLESEWAIASSKRLLAELDKLKASKTSASRYSSGTRLTPPAE